MPSPDAWLALQILETISYAIALLTSAYRIIHRIRIARFWWDDFWALVSALQIAVLLAFFYVQPWVNDHGSTASQIAVAWLVPLVFNIVVWTTRISIIYSVTRVLSPGKWRTISLIIIYAFFLCCAGVFAGKVWLCGHDTTWHDMVAPFCPQNDALSIVQVTTDILSSLCLAFFPLYVLWKVDLPSTERRLVLSLFTSSILITGLAISHSIFAFEMTLEAEMLFGVTGHFEASISQTICNLLVVGTRLYRVFFRRGEDKPLATPPPGDVTNQLEAHLCPPVSFTQITAAGAGHAFSNTTFSYPSLSGGEESFSHSKRPPPAPS